MRLIFGKYRGWRVADVPASYAAWLLEEARSLDPALRRALRAELADRFGFAPPAPRPPTPEVAAAAAAIVHAGYRAVAMRAHPDRGGSHEAMIAATSANAWLKARVTP